MPRVAQGKYRIDVRLDEAFFRRFDAKRRADGFQTISEGVRSLIMAYLKDERASETDEGDAHA
jgi:metal-responsive CopG/Arc/MetJ family transcriptional regulator